MSGWPGNRISVLRRIASGADRTFGRAVGESRRTPQPQSTATVHSLVSQEKALAGTNGVLDTELPSYQVTPGRTGKEPVFIIQLLPPSSASTSELATTFIAVSALATTYHDGGLVLILKFGARRAD